MRIFGSSWPKRSTTACVPKSGEQLDQTRRRAQPAKQHGVVRPGGLVELQQPVEQERRGRREIARHVGAALGAVVDQHRQQPGVEPAAARIGGQVAVGDQELRIDLGHHREVQREPLRGGELICPRFARRDFLGCEQRAG